MNPRAWIVTKQGMTGDLYEALAWNNDGKPLGVSITTPTPLYEGEALRAKLTKLDDLLAVIHRDLVTLKDVFDKVPREKIRACMLELAKGMDQSTGLTMTWVKLTSA